jgi:hypothetical protein
MRFAGLSSSLLWGRLALAEQRPSINQAMLSTTTAVAASVTLATNDTQTLSAQHCKLRLAPSSA